MSHVDQLIPHMRRVQLAERDLSDLGVVWQMIETSAAISCPDEAATILPTLVETRSRFDGMRGKLIERMVDENRAALGDELGARAQCAIDILIRNLFERTADVGFLATDAAVCDFCSASPDEREHQRDAMRQRLQHYQAKYTVYDDIVLLSPDGEVLVRLDAAAQLSTSTDSLVQRALSANAYVEAFGASDLQSSGEPSLRYAHRIVDGHGSSVGVLVLRFRFVDEMVRIFKGVSDEQGHTAIVLLDESNHVIATNDESHVSLRARMPSLECGDVVLTSFSGREYLAVCCESQGYQGYAGPKWRALAMVSLLTAFSAANDKTDAIAVPLDYGELVAVERDADAINRELRRVIWNGRLMTGHDGDGRSRLKAVLRQVSLAGVRTRRRLEQAIVDLSRTSLSRTCDKARQLARLAADIMDRNLYERANDCRWWALSPVLRRLMSQPVDAEAQKQMNAVLDHINGLYTVYSRLVVFDTRGQVCAASNCAAEPGPIGTQVPSPWVDAVRTLRDPQQYKVSDFGPTPLHDAGDTYVYLAGIHGEGSDRAVVGGIAIVFNSARELKAMLNDILGARKGFAAFVDAQGRVLASTDAQLAGSLLPSGFEQAEILKQNDTMWACAQSQAEGYREFKVSDGYDNHVRAVVGLSIGGTERRGLRYSDYELLSPNVTRKVRMEAAVFQVGGGRYALATDSVLEVVSRQRLVRSPGQSGAVIGMLPIDSSAAGGGQAVPVLCARRLLNIDRPARATDGVVLLMRRMQGERLTLFGLRVDDVLSVIEVHEGDLHPVPGGAQGPSAALNGLINCKASNGKETENVLVQLLDSDRLADALGSYKALVQV